LLQRVNDGRTLRRLPGQFLDELLARLVLTRRDEIDGFFHRTNGQIPCPSTKPLGEDRPIIGPRVPPVAGGIAGEIHIAQRAGVGVEITMKTGGCLRVAEVGVGGGEAAELGVVEAGLEVVEPRLGVEFVAGVGEAVPDEARG